MGRWQGPVVYATAARTRGSGSPRTRGRHPHPLLHTAQYIRSRPDRFDVKTFAWPGSARAALELIDDGYARWSASVRALDEAALARDVGHIEPWPAPMAALVLHINREIIHHGAEVALLRDL